MAKGKKGNGKKDCITKEDAIYFLKLGDTPQEIFDCFSGLSLGTLRTLKSHVTKGTYGKGEERRA
jgi:hypothetical protein